MKRWLFRWLFLGCDLTVAINPIIQVSHPHGFALRFCDMQQRRLMARYTKIPNMTPMSDGD